MTQRRERLAELVRFGLLSVVSAGITLGLPVLLHERLGVDPRLAVAIGFGTAFVVNFIMMRLFVFRHQGSAAVALGRYAGSSLVLRGAEYAGFLLLFQAGMRYYIAQFIVVGVSFCVKFVVMRYLVFKPTRAEPTP